MDVCQCRPTQDLGYYGYQLLELLELLEQDARRTRAGGEIQHLVSRAFSGSQDEQFSVLSRFLCFRPLGAASDSSPIGMRCIFPYDQKELETTQNPQEQLPHHSRLGLPPPLRLQLCHCFPPPGCFQPPSALVVSGTWQAKSYSRL